MTFAQAFIDASYDENPKHPLCCGAYVFLADQAVAFDQVWRKEILEHYGLSVFHMADCNQHKGEFKKLDAEGSDECARKAYSIIKDHTAFGCAATLMVKDYDRILKPHTDNWSGYVFCLFECLCLIANWCRRVGFDGEIAYLFEAGDPDQKNANRLMNEVLNSPRNKKRFHVLNFGFGQKIDNTPLQAADVIAPSRILPARCRRIS